MPAKRILELDGLRGLAIGLVVFFHLGMKLPLWQPLHNLAMFGWSGVDLFFVLSGFLIGGILLDHRGSENYFSTFYLRRFFRIVPVYLLILTGYLLAWCIAGHRHADLIRLLDPPMSWYAYLSFTNNIWIAHHNSMQVFLAPSWSLAVEEQFYLTLPLVVRFLPRRYLGIFLGGVIVSVAVARSLACYLGMVTQNQAYALPWFRVDALLIGVTCALLVRNERVVESLRRRVWLLYAAIGAIMLALTVIGSSLPDSHASPANPLMAYGLTLVALLYASLLLLVLLAPGHFLPRLFRLRALGLLSGISYCVYLVHETLLSAAIGMLPAHSSVLVKWGTALIAVMVTLLVAQASWVAVESPLVRFAHRFSFGETRPNTSGNEALQLPVAQPQLLPSEND